MQSSNFYKIILSFIFIYLISNVTLALEVNNYYGDYDVTTKKPWRIATSLSGPYTEQWVVPTAKKTCQLRPAEAGGLNIRLQSRF